MTTALWPRHKSTIISGALLWLALVLTFFAYQPGLTGGFLLDDWANLVVLGEYGGVYDLPRLLLYLTSGGGDATGRPVTLLSFLIDGQTWPSEAGPFKRTGVLLHLLNGSLLCWAVFRLGLRNQINASLSIRAAVLTASLWMMHPFLVSTTLYVIQRASMLAATGFLLAVLAWDCAWKCLEQQRLWSAWLFGFCAVGAATLLATLSKANGALTPLLLALIWQFFYRPRQHLLSPRSAQHELRLRVTAIALPALATVFALAMHMADSAAHAASTRPWSLWQRVISQPRALVDYLSMLVFPNEGSRGIFTDDFAVSNSLLAPPSTLFAMLALIALVVMIWRYRHQPLIAFPAAFFLVAHSMESGFIALEPYFEHRNYLPALFLFWPVAFALLRPDIRRPQLRQSIAMAIALMLATLTFMRASSWSNDELMARAAVYRYPGSLRAQLYVSSFDIEQGKYADAIQRLRQATLRATSQPLLYFNLLHAQCLSGHLSPPDLEGARTALLNSKAWYPEIYVWLSDRLQAPGNGICNHLAKSQISNLVDALAANPQLERSSDAQQSIFALQGELALLKNDLPQATQLLTKSLRQKPSLDTCLWLAYLFQRYNQQTAGESFLRSNSNCRRSESESFRGINELHMKLLTRYPEYDNQRTGLERDFHII